MPRIHGAGDRAVLQRHAIHDWLGGYTAISIPAQGTTRQAGPAGAACRSGQPLKGYQCLSNSCMSQRILFYSSPCYLTTGCLLPAGADADQEFGSLAHAAAGGLWPRTLCSTALWRCHGRLHHPLQMFGLVGPQLLTSYASQAWDLLHLRICHQHSVYSSFSLPSTRDTSTPPGLERPSIDTVSVAGNVPSACVVVSTSLLVTPRANSLPSGPAQQAGCLATVCLCSFCSAASPCLQTPSIDTVVPTTCCASQPHLLALQQMFLYAAKTRGHPAPCLQSPSANTYVFTKCWVQRKGPDKQGLHQVPAALWATTGARPPAAATSSCWWRCRPLGAVPALWG